MSVFDGAISFSIPSIHDDMTLGGRVYHPAALTNDDGDDAGSWRGRGAVFAHPYAPLGGCQEDPVVMMVVEELLRVGYIVCTFNFRGAGASKGHTSWTAKAETADYLSIVGFFGSYLSHLRASCSSAQATASSSDLPLSPIPSHTIPLAGEQARSDENPLLILGGYSYGSMIATFLPPVETIMSRFEGAAKGGIEDEITSRARRLASHWIHEQALKASARGRKYRGIGMAGARSRSRVVLMVGGEECEAGSRRTSRDHRRSLDSIRRSFDFSRERRAIRRSCSSMSDESGSCALPTRSEKTMVPKTAFLLVSPLLPPVSSLATLFTEPWKAFGRASDMHQQLTVRQTLAIYGAHDSFTPLRKLRRWSAELSKRSLHSGGAGACFQAQEISGAGHFWNEAGAEDRLRAAVKQYAGRLAGT